MTSKDHAGGPLARLERTLDDDPLIGRELDGRYRLLERIGSGGMGAVYRALQLSVDREVAVKVIQPHVATDIVATKRFLREARLASRVQHPATVMVLDSGRTPDGVLYLVMELIVGRPLRDLIARSGPLSVPRALHIGAQIADALEAAHGIDVVHRDLKPGNVIVLDEPAGQDLVKVVDFGLAKSLEGIAGESTITQSGNVCGTPAYISPEAAMAGEVDGRADLYSLGVMLYEMVTRRLPFESKSAERLIIMHATAEPVALPPTVPAVVAHTVMRLLAKDPEDRYRSAAILAEALRAAREQVRRQQRTADDQPPLSGRPLDATTTDQHRAIEQVRPTVPNAEASRPGSLFKVALALALIGLGALLAWVLSDRADPAPAPTEDAPAKASTPPPDTLAPSEAGPLGEPRAPIAAESRRPRRGPATFAPPPAAKVAAPAKSKRPRVTTRPKPKAKPKGATFLRPE